MSAPNVVDLVTRAVLERLRAEGVGRVDDIVRAAQADAQRRLDEFLRTLPTMPLPEPEPVDVKTDARERAGRTALQGAIATALVAAVLAVAGVIGGDGFDITSGGDWKAVAGAAIAAVVAAGAAYVQRLVKPPRSTDRGAEYRE
ncbi:hypothetical protein IU451_30130 [Nocardia cyriacigeorgica]|uniref:hypothetical protein n=1 Tax=Nocardia cyriacigeorgica TaxID=135487 RepID=UPI001894693F|nr:hypothetical protein [Nocardia cyriacigeorgica]MBF6326757.1 hypothetical protein [Nocardia cyriacigeorgica]